LTSLPSLILPQSTADYLGTMRILILIGLCSLMLACSPERESTLPEVGPITSAVYASGVVKARDQYQAFGAVGGLVSHVHVQAGDTVRKGDALFTIDDRASSLGSQRAELAVDLLRQNAGGGSPVLEQLRLAVEQARTRLTNDSLMYMRQKHLWDQRVGSKVELDNRELAYTSARNSYKSATKAYTETRDRLRSELRMAENDLAMRRAAEGDHTVRSLLDGRVYAVLIERGELASTQRALAILGRADAFLLELQVDEYDIVRIAAGQRVWVTMDSYKDRVLEATVTRIDPLMNERSRTFTVEAEFVEPPPQLYPNLTVEANIVIAKKEKAITIPTSYLLDGKYVVTDAEEPQPLTIGLRDLQRVEVMEGLDSTTRIYRP
jgi:HlyD family secretion protein